MQKENIEAVVALRTHHSINPIPVKSIYHALVYGTGLKPKESASIHK